MALSAPFIALALAGVALPETHAAASDPQEAATTDVVITRDDWHERMTVPVTVIGQGPFHFLIDTGSQNTVISSSLAARIGVKASSSAMMISITGRERVETVELDEIALGKRSFTSLLVPLLEEQNIGAEGIVGLDSLQGQRVLIDFARNVMAIDDAKSLGGNRGYEIIVTAKRRSGQLIMTNAKIDGVLSEVNIDTGSENSIGNRALQRALSHRFGSEKGTLRGVTGEEIPADFAVGRSLTFGTMSGGGTINNIAIAYADALPFTYLGLDQKPALFLGMRELRVFRRVAIDFASRKILFDVPASADPHSRSITGRIDGREF